MLHFSLKYPPRKKNGRKEVVRTLPGRDAVHKPWPHKMLTNHSIPTTE